MTTGGLCRYCGIPSVRLYFVEKENGVRRIPLCGSMGCLQEAEARHPGGQAIRP